MKLFSKKNPARSNNGEVAAKTTLGSRERRLLSETVHVEEELLPSFVRSILWLVGLMVCAFIIWAGVTQMKEVARAPGEIMPAGKIKVVQHLDGGAVAEIFVEERMLVNEGDVLLRIDGSQAIAELRQMEARRDALLLREARLQALVQGAKPDFDSLEINQREMVAGERALYLTQLATRASTLSILDRQIEQREQRLKQLDKALKVARQHQQLTQEMAENREELGSRKLITRTVLLETRRAQLTAMGEVARLEEEISVAKQELAEVINRKADAVNQAQRESMGELGQVRSELAEVDETIRRLQAKVDRLEMRATSPGYIQDLKVYTIGQVIQPGALLMQIVPVDDVLEAEVRISPRDIGFVEVGQRVEMRVGSYDYSKYGTAKGTLERVSATRLVGPDNNPYFRGLISLDHPYVGNEPGVNPLQPGMSVEAEILTGQKTLLAYLLKPLSQLTSSSFRER